MLKLEVGKFYKTRDGEVVEIVRNDCDQFCDEKCNKDCWIGSNDLNYYPTGNYFLGERHDYDLIEETPDDLMKEEKMKNEKMDTVSAIAKILDIFNCEIDSEQLRQLSEILEKYKNA